MAKWDNFPFLRLLIPLLLGIFTSLYCPIPFINIISISFLAFAFVFIFFNAYKGLSLSYKVRSIPNIILFTATFLLSNIITEQHKIENNPTHFSNRSLPNQVMAQVVNDPEPSANSVKTIIECKAAIGKNMSPISGKIMTFFFKDSAALSLQYGDLIILNFHPQKVSERKYPFEFDYSQYLKSKNIYHTLYLNANDWKKTSINHANPIISLGLQARDRFVEIFTDAIGKSEESAIVAGMFCGYRAELSAETMASFSNTGVIHIMSVSGLHVGVIYLMLGFLLSYLPWLRHRKIIRIIFIIIVIWFYTLISGLSASIVRASLMITFIAIGEIAKQKINPINSVSAAAFLLLIINPMNIFDIGFQLSFSAVIGIFLLYKPIQKWWTPKQKVLKYIRDLAALSLAAQIATFPITSFYFHQFPTYFLPANFFAVPLSGIILYISFALLVLSPIPWISDALAWVLELSVKILVDGIALIEKLPMSTIRGIFPNEWVSTLSLFSIFLLWYSFRNKVKIVFFAAAIILLTAIGSATYSKISRNQEDFSYCYNKSGNLIFAIKDRQTLHIAYAVLQPEKLNRQRDFLKSAKEYYQMKTIQWVDLLSTTNYKSPVLYFQAPFLYIKQQLLIIDSQSKYHSTGVAGHIKRKGKKWEMKVSNNLNNKLTPIQP